MSYDTASPLRNFTLTLGERIRGMAGAPAYSVRLRRIEDEEERALNRISAALRADARQLERALDSIDLERLNVLIDQHNRYFPIEANLPLDVRTGGSLWQGRPFAPRRPWTRQRLLEEARLHPRST